MPVVALGGAPAVEAEGAGISDMVVTPLQESARAGLIRRLAI
jgi:hypothetical protein